jgi:O-antigen ligase
VAGRELERDWIAKKNYILLIVMFLAFPFMSHAGGLGIAAIAALTGLLGIIGFWPVQIKGFLLSVPAVLWAIMAVLIWALISVSWSPYQSDNVLNNATKILLGMPVYLGCAAMIVGQNKYANNILPWLLVLITFGSIVAILVDIMTNYSLSLLVDPMSDGEPVAKRQGDMIQNVSHAVSVLVLLATPVGMFLWLKGGISKVIAVILIGLIGFITFKTNSSAAQVGLFAALVFMGFASIKPNLALKSAFTIAGSSLLFAPLLAFVSGELSPGMRAKLPFSWEERVFNWEVIYQKILEHPIIGHGFDAVRTFNDTHTIRGFEGRALVSLHPHNAGLHLWVEVGFVGVALACIALFLGTRKLVTPGVLSKSQMVAASGLCTATAIMASLSYGVWQDWWWAAIIIAAASVSFIQKPS